jgi:hypothetical protein
MPRLVLLVVLPVAVALLITVHRAGAHADRVVVNADGTEKITQAARAAGLRFAPTVTPGDRAWILAAVAQARPEARRLIGEIDGLVTVSTELGGAGAHVETVGWAQRAPEGRFRVGLNISELDGERAIDRNVVVLHELGHVVDWALVAPSLDRQLDAGIPRGGSCGDTPGPFGGCAPAAERFADTFAKWSLAGAVSAVGAGYGIATPASLEDWGRPLGALAARVP